MMWWVCMFRGYHRFAYKHCTVCGAYDYGKR